MDAISAIKNDLARLKRLRDDTDQQISELQTTLGVIARYKDESPPVGDVAQEIESQRGESGSAKPSVVAHMVANFLGQGELWSSLPDLSERLAEAGVKIGGKDPVSNLSTILSRHKVVLGLVANKRRGWALASRVGRGPFDESGVVQ